MIRPRPPVPLFNPVNWYWFVGGDQTQAYSSASGVFVPASDPTFQAWLAAGNNTSHQDTTANLGTYLFKYGLTPVDPNVLDGYQNAQLNAIDKVQFKILFNHENRIRTLEARPPVTVPQFLAAVKALL